MGFPNRFSGEDEVDILGSGEVSINLGNRSGSCCENCGSRVAQVVRCHSGWFLAARIFRGFFIFGLPDFFLIFGKCPEVILQHNPRQNPPKFTPQNSPTHFCRGARPRDAIPRMELRIEFNHFLNDKSCSRIPWNSPRAPRMAFSLLNSNLGNGVGKRGYGNRPPIDDRSPIIRKFSIDCLDAYKTIE